MPRGLQQFRLQFRQKNSFGCGVHVFLPDEVHAQGFGKLTFSLSAQGDSMGMTVG
jgi:hypothetical protein